MKKYFWRYLTCLALACAFASCSEEQSFYEEGISTLTFNVSLYEKTEMDGSTRANLVDASKAFSKLSVVFFKGEEAVETVTQDEKEDGEEFGKVSVTLPYGSYKVVAIGHKGNADVTIDSPTAISFPNNELSDPYYVYREMEINKDSESQQTLELKHAAARFTLDTTDNFPANIGFITFTITGGGTVFNAVTGCAVEIQEQIKSYNVESRAGKTPTVNVYSFLTTTGEEKLTIKVTATDKEGKLIAERTFTEVPMQRNYSTTYRGAFFTNTGKWTIVVDQAYVKDTEHSF